MANVYLCADLHLGHRNIAKYRNLPDEDTHYQVQYDAWHSRVGNKDKVFVLGDVCFTKEMWERFATWSGRKVVILGNHCTERNSHLDIPPSIELHGSMTYKGAWLTHIPVHHTELRGKLNIHGHCHSFVVPDPRYLCVSSEQIGYVPISFDEIKQEFARRRSLLYVAKKFGTIEAIKAFNRRRKVK